mmetsp:Transcript_19528/g.35709  ORF Transcript_19528/g.35709 Transcript_19528/m.35709 type:complete len:282 (-) Transcript_19528:1212-2057(-)
MSLAETVDRIKALIYSDDLVQAYEVVEAVLEQNIINREKLMSVPEIALLWDDMEMAGQCMEMLSDIVSWTPVYNDDAIATFFKGSGNEFFVRAEMQMHQPLFPLIALFSEVDLLSQWVSVVKSADVICMPTPYRRLLRFRFDMPWPVTDREAVVSVVGIPVPYNRSALLVIRSVDGSNYLSFPIPDTSEGDVRIDINICCVNIVYNGPEETHLSLIVRSDPKIAMLPKFLINFATKHVMYYLMDTIREKVKNYAGSEYERRVMQNPQYYTTFHNKLSTFDA